MIIEELTLTTPALLFSAVSLILLAYTNRFLSYAQIVRMLIEKHQENPTYITKAQINNLRQRLYLIRFMQIAGVSSLLSCVLTMYMIYIGLQTLAAYIFWLALIMLITSLATSIWEIQISVKALDISLKDLESK